MLTLSFLLRRVLFTLVAIQIFFYTGSAGDTLKLSQFSDCQSDADIIVDRINTEYDATTRQIIFDIAGRSKKVQNVTASLKVEAYGKDVYTKSFNPCDATTFVAGLCPVPTGEFAAKSTETIPAEQASQIPPIAFSIPDIALQATLSLKRLEDGKNVGCVVADLSNGKSVNSKAISYIAGGVAAAALLIGAATSLAGGGSGSGEPGESPGASPSFYQMMGWFGSLATSGMLSINYAPLYVEFTTRFSFSTGLISIPPMQRAIDNMRSKTGGAVTLDNIKNSTKSIVSRELFERANTTQTPLLDQNVTQALGIQKYVEKSGIVQENAFMTVFLVATIVILAIVVAILFFKVILETWALCGSFPKSLTGFRKRYWRTAFRTNVTLIKEFYGNWVVFCIFQFRTGGSWAATLLAAVTLALFSGILLFFIVKIIQTARKHIKSEGSAAGLFENKELWLKYSMFYDVYSKKSWWFFGPVILYNLVKSALLAGLNGRGHGFAQTVSIIVVEAIMLVLYIFIRPCERRRFNIVNISIQFVRVLQMAALLVFVQELKVERSTQTVMGFALVIVTSVFTGLLVLLMVINGFYTCCKDNPHRKRRKEAEKLKRESEFFLDPKNNDTSYRTEETMEQGPIKPYRDRDL
ncbi:hypothetical protein BGZ60DRAFT_530904 [Tricladium varicosporioides]|nr:hypothetical protein BGZ60DRAFT_530904 [Hymenoscyphus varicosporioides]